MHSCVLVYTIYRRLARPHAHRAILAALDKISIFYPDTLNDGVTCVVRLVNTNTRSATPVAAIGLIVHLDYILTSCRDNAARVEHHACYGVVVRVGIVDGASSEIPDLGRGISG